ncbi:hypothetical protein LEP1GSC062_4022 [Leptospira alexanderi serovar Manhao 3 str. L 60]|uniref:Uncharacterized protein n=1 Tax=Leptospira alexanderi serovar Manhao 3 str. L 60 TaxID=1049759 RepID=V6I4F4_9LEPT|nr:hypothetical protein LEP1GSC062_4022 [Leptospira alexanderi serovar Manhao 3 str. L 60]
MGSGRIISFVQYLESSFPNKIMSYLIRRLDPSNKNILIR